MASLYCSMSARHPQLLVMVRQGRTCFGLPRVSICTLEEVEDHNMNVPKSPLTLDVFFPERTLIAPLTTMDVTHRIFEGEFRLDTVTGNSLAIAGKMPLICRNNVATL